MKRTNLTTWDKIIGPPWDSYNLSAFIIFTIFVVNFCIAAFISETKELDWIFRKTSHQWNRSWHNIDTIETSDAIRVWLTLKGPLSVLKLIPGTYFNQTGKPLEKKKECSGNIVAYITFLILYENNSSVIKYPKFHSAQA